MPYKTEIVDRIKEMLIDRKRTLSVAESATSGHLQAIMSTAKDASKFFQGGITVYNAGQKCRHLSIEPVHALENDCVTEEVAKKMAKEVNGLFISDYGISVTGYAARMPEKDINDLFAFFSIAFKKKTILSGRLTSDEAEGIDAQIDFTNQVMSKLEYVLVNEKSRGILV